MKRCPRIFLLFLSSLVVLSSYGCTGKHSRETQGPELNIGKGEMIYARQVLEHYDGKGNAVPRYYELWAARGKSACRELNSNGEEIITSLDSGESRIAFNSGTGEAEKLQYSRAFLLDYKALKKLYPEETINEDQVYIGRDCTVHLLENDDSDAWLKIYRDSETGFVLFCDAPLFTLKTAGFEVLPEDPDRFTEPAGLNFKH